MKFIITENQYKLLEQKVFTGKTEYSKAIVRYENQMKFYNIFNSFRKYENKKISYITLGKDFYENPHIKKWINVSASGDILLSLLWCKQKTASKEDCNRLMKSMGSPKIIGWFKILLDDNMKYLVPDGASYLIKLRKPYGDFNNPTLSGFLKEKGFFYLPIIEEPIKPVLEEPKEEKPILSEPISNLPSKKETIVTDYVVQWQENGRQKVKYFPNFNAWNEFVESKSNIPFMSKEYNKSLGYAGITYYGNPGLEPDEL